MKPVFALLVAAVILAGTTLTPRSASASNNNDFIEVAKTTSYGALGGLLVGSAIALISDSGEPVKWGFVVGTFGGLFYGVSHLSSSRASLMEVREGHLATGGLAAVEAAPGSVRVRAIGMRF